MKQIMSCEQFAKGLDLYLDSELNAVQRAAFIEHAQACPECGERLESATRLLTMCAELDDGIEMPLDGQAAWRSAVRGEVKRRKSMRLPTFVRGLSTVAAALLIIAGGTYAYQSMGPLSLDASNGTKLDGGYAPQTMTTIGYTPQTNPFSKEAGAGDILLTDGGLMGESEATGATIGDAETPYTPSIETTPPDEPSGFDPGAPDSAIKEIKSASRDIQTIAYDSDYAEVKDLIEEYEGHVDSERGYGAPLATGQPNGRSLYLSARIPSGEISQFLKSLDAVGTIVARSQDSYEITQQYYDAATRLKYQKALRQELEAMKPQSVSELIEVKRELANVQAEIDSLEGQIKDWDSRVAYSTVDISLNEVADKLAVQPIDKSSLMERLRAGFADSINMLSTFAQEMLVFVAMFWPWVVLALIVVITVCASVRRRRKNRV